MSGRHLVGLCAFTLALGVPISACVLEPEEVQAPVEGPGAEVAAPQPGTSCQTDSDCFHTGCSGQICASAPVFTTCQFTCEFGCLQQADCICLNNKCRFDRDPELISCLDACQPPVIGSPCGANVCGPSEFCCNPSCGICAPIGGACIQIACN